MQEWSNFKKGVIVAAVVICGLVGVGGVNNKIQNQRTGDVTPTAVQGTSSTLSPIEDASPPIDDTSDSTDTSSDASSLDSTDDSSAVDSSLSNDNTYTNVDGNTVHSPAYSTDGTIPAGATAQCADGTYSFSLHRSGTCSYHGGVATWL